MAPFTRANAEELPAFAMFPKVIQVNVKATRLVLSVSLCLSGCAVVEVFLVEISDISEITMDKNTIKMVSVVE